MSDPKDAAVETIQQVVSRSFDAMQSQELRSPHEAGAHAANAAFTIALTRDLERRSRRRPARKPSFSAVSIETGEES